MDSESFVWGAKTSEIVNFSNDQSPYPVVDFGDCKDQGMDSSISSNSLVSSWMSLMASCSSRKLASIFGPMGCLLHS